MIVHHLIQVIALVTLGPLMLGIIDRARARLAGRRGPPLLQSYFEIAKLFRKRSVISDAASWIFVAAPATALVAVLLAGLLVPVGPAPAPIAFAGDFVLLVGLLGLARLATAAAALDTGSALGGLGAARRVEIAAFAEVALFLALLAMAAVSRSSSLSGMVEGVDRAVVDGATAPMVLVVVTLVMVLLAEGASMPVDDRHTNFELTMTGELSTLEYSGPLLAMIRLTAAIRLVLFSSLVVRVALPVTGSVVLSWLLFFALTLVLALIIGLFESFSARLRLNHVPAMLVTACLFAGFGFVMVVA